MTAFIRDLVRTSRRRRETIGARTLATSSLSDRLLSAMDLSAMNLAGTDPGQEGLVERIRLYRERTQFRAQRATMGTGETTGLDGMLAEYAIILANRSRFADLCGLLFAITLLQSDDIREADAGSGTLMASAIAPI
jgi:hypothetical protein